MKLLKTLGLLAFFSFIFSSCNCCKKSSCTKTGAKDGTYNAVMTFVSKGSGPDRKSHKAFNSYIESIEEKDKKLSIEKITWGREGEKDYCINFLCVKKKEKNSILNKLKTIAETSEYTYLKENISCKHKK